MRLLSKSLSVASQSRNYFRQSFEKCSIVRTEAIIKTTLGEPASFFKKQKKKKTTTNKQKDSIVYSTNTKKSP